MTERMYNDPVGGTPSTIGATQFNEFKYQKQALVEARKTQFFTQMADTTAMPKHFGKKIKQYHYLPIMDDANINDQGIDANGVSSDDANVEYTVRVEGNGTGENTYLNEYLVGEGANAGTAQTAAEALVVTYAIRVLSAAQADYATAKASLEAAGYTVTEYAAVPHSGNLYGSSKDVGVIAAKMPALSEQGGRVNRVGMKRIEIEGSIEKFGFFDEYTKESVDFDTDDQLMMHVNREMINAANEITEDALQVDLLNAAGVVRFGGEAISTATITGTQTAVDNSTESLVTYADLMRLSIDLDNNRCPKNTKIISGTRMIDTKVIDAARYIYIGSELIPMVKKMVDHFGNQAFIPVQSYAAGGNLAIGEIGTIDQFRIIVVPEMQHWAGAGAAEGTNGGFRATGGNYDVYPMLVVGSGSFTTIGFQTDGKSVKFKIKHVKPESETSYSKDDPYGESGFMSIKWYYGSMILRPERIAVVKTIAEW